MSATQYYQRKNHGFTLIEILVVLVIVAILTAVAVLSFGHFGRGRQQKLIVQQFMRVIAGVQQQAIIMPAVMGLLVFPDGYRIEECAKLIDSQCRQWKKMTDDPFSNDQAFANRFDVSVSGEQSVTFGHLDSVHVPWIVFVPSGYVTPFDLTLKSQMKTFHIQVFSNGRVIMKEGASSSL